MQSNVVEKNVQDVSLSRADLELSVVAPAYNEQDNLPALVSRLLKVFQNKDIKGEVVIVNDCSTDKTAEILNDLASKHPEVVAVHHETNRGLTGGWDTGVAASSGHYVCLIDSDLQNPPEEVWRLYKKITNSNADMVQGVRSSIGRLKDARYTLSRGLNICLNLLFGMSATDNKSGFVIAEKETLQHVLEREFDYKYFHTFITVAAKYKNYSVEEIETLFQDRYAGDSYINHFPVKLISEVLIDLSKAFCEYRLFGRKQQDSILHKFLEQNPPKETVKPYRGWRRALYEAFFATMPLHKWLITRNARRMFENLKRSEWLTLEQTKELQELKLRRLISFVYRHVPFYRERMEEAGFSPKDIRTLEDLQKLDFVSKDDVRDNLYFDLFADNHRKRDMHKIATSGSTGEPFVTYADRYQLEMRWATTMRALEWTGWRFGDKQARLWHQKIGMTPLQVFRERMDALFMRRLFVPAFEMSESNLRDFFQKIRNHNPVIVDGYAESFNFLAHYAEHNGVEGFKPKAIMSSAQTMPDKVRKIIEERFSSQVFDKYGSREFSGIAYECEKGEGHHVMAESYIVEILKDGQPAKPGEIGEVVITDLNNFSVPLIRYRIGDLAVAVDQNKICSCGRGLPLIGKIEGRAQAVIVCNNGTWLPGTFFQHFFKEYDHLIRQFQIVQDEKESIALRFIRGAVFSDKLFNEMLSELQKFVGAEMKILPEEVEEIPLGRTGKRTSVVSNLKHEFQELSANLELGQFDTTHNERAA